MVLMSSELSELIRASDKVFSRRNEFAKCFVTEKLNLKQSCKISCTKHNHGEVVVSNQRNYIGKLSDVVISKGLPSSKVLKAGIESLKAYDVSYFFISNIFT